MDFPRTKQYSILVYWLGWDKKEDRAKDTTRHTFTKALSPNQYLSNLISPLQNWNQHSTFKTRKKSKVAARQRKEVQLRTTQQEDKTITTEYVAQQKHIEPSSWAVTCCCSFKEELWQRVSISLISIHKLVVKINKAKNKN